MKRLSRIFLLAALAFLALVSASCSLGKPKEPTTNPDAIYTSAAETVAVQLTQRATMNPSPTDEPTLAPSATMTISQATNPVLISTSTSIPQTVNTITLPAVQDKVEFLSQTPADGSSIAANQAFKVVWEIKNAGQTTWNTAYKMRFFSGNRIGLGLPNEYNFTKEVKPGETYQVIVDFLAGANLGEFQSNWVLTNQQGANFYPLYIVVRIINATSTPEPSLTATTDSATTTVTTSP